MISDIVILEQISSTIILYANCVKKGYRTIRYFKNPDEILTITAESPNIVLRDLEPGEYYLYAENKNSEQTGFISFTISGLTRETIFNNIALNAGLTLDEKICGELSVENYICELYNRMISEEDVSEELLLAFIDFYNIQTEELNGRNITEFYVQNQSVTSCTGLTYQFVPYVYENTTDSWKLLENQRVFDKENIDVSLKPRSLFQISVLSDFQLVRKYYIYQPSETLSTAILERRIQTIQNRNNVLTELINEINLEDIADDSIGQKTVAALSYFKSDHAIFRSPEIVIEGTKLSYRIPDYSCIALLDRPIYLAILELEEIFSEAYHPHKSLIESENATIKLSRFLINEDTEYICYLTDENNIILSDPILISMDPEYRTALYTSAYKRTAYDKYVRKLSGVCKEYGKDKWNRISLLLEQYLLHSDTDESFHEFLWKQFLTLQPEREPIHQYIALVVLCRMKYYTNIDQSFIHHQVYSKMFNDHIFPEHSKNYIVCVTRFKGNEITYEYYKAGKESLNIAMNKDDYLLLQCLDPETWKMSAPALYNNRVKYTTPYIYFPKLEVEVI